MYQYHYVTRKHQRIALCQRLTQNVPYFLTLSVSVTHGIFLTLAGVDQCGWLIQALLPANNT